MLVRSSPSPSPKGNALLGTALEVTQTLDRPPDPALRLMIARNVYRRILILENARANSPLNLNSYLLQALAAATAERKAAEQDVADLKRDASSDRCLNQALMLETYIAALAMPDEASDKVRRHIFKWCELILSVAERATILNEVRRFGRGR